MRGFVPSLDRANHLSEFLLTLRTRFAVRKFCIPLAAASLATSLSLWFGRLYLTTKELSKKCGSKVLARDRNRARLDGPALTLAADFRWLRTHSHVAEESKKRVHA